MKILKCRVSQSLWDLIEKRHKTSGESINHIIATALADGLKVPDYGTLFQVSTSGALVEGVYQGAISVAELMKHGDFGLGTFEDLDGEMVALNGQCYQARADGTVTIADQKAHVPFAVVTNFKPEQTVKLPSISSFNGLTRHLDQLRNTENLFFALKIEGTFDYIKTRVVCKAKGPETLVESAGKQTEFEFSDVKGTLVGFWTPEYARTINIAGYHLHFLTDNHKSGGHLLDCRAKELTVKIEHSADFRMAIPETATFLKADLTRDPSKELDQAERQH